MRNRDQRCIHATTRRKRGSSEAQQFIRGGTHVGHGLGGSQRRKGRPEASAGVWRTNHGGSSGRRLMRVQMAPGHIGRDGSRRLTAAGGGHLSTLVRAKHGGARLNGAAGDAEVDPARTGRRERPTRQRWSAAAMTRASQRRVTAVVAQRWIEAAPRVQQLGWARGSH